MSILSWIVFGAVVGIIANILDPRPSSGGIFGATILGIVGALVGGFLASTLLGYSVNGFNFSSFFVALIGSLLLLVLGRAFRGKSV